MIPPMPVLNDSNFDILIIDHIRFVVNKISVVSTLPRGRSFETAICRSKKDTGKTSGSIRSFSLDI